MNFPITSLIAMTLLAGAGLHVRGAERPHNYALRVETPANNPALAQNNPAAFYLHTSGSGRTLLYVEKQDGSGLAILDVTDPGRIRRTAEISLAAHSAFDFEQSLGDNAVLIRYRDGSGVALLNFMHSQRPVLAAAPSIDRASSFETLGQTGLLAVAAEAFNSPAEDLQTYRVLDITGRTGPSVLLTVPDVRQRVANDETGTLFLLNSHGVNVVRRLQAEQQHQAELIREQGN